MINSTGTRNGFAAASFWWQSSRAHVPQYPTDSDPGKLNLVVRVFASSATSKTGKVKKKRTQVVVLESRSLSLAKSQSAEN